MWREIKQNRIAGIVSSEERVVVVVVVVIVIDNPRSERSYEQRSWPRAYDLSELRLRQHELDPLGGTRLILAFGQRDLGLERALEARLIRAVQSRSEQKVEKLPRTLAARLLRGIDKLGRQRGISLEGLLGFGLGLDDPIEGGDEDSDDERAEAEADNEGRPVEEQLSARLPKGHDWIYDCDQAGDAQGGQRARWRARWRAHWGARWGLP